MTPGSGIPSDFSTTLSGPIVLAPGDSIILPITYSPGFNWQQADVILVDENLIGIFFFRVHAATQGVAELEISHEGNIIGDFDPISTPINDTLDLGFVTLNQTKSIDLVLKNLSMGSGSLPITSIGASSEAFPPTTNDVTFSLAPSFFNPSIINAGDSVVLNLLFTANEIGEDYYMVYINPKYDVSFEKYFILKANVIDNMSLNELHHEPMVLLPNPVYNSTHIECVFGVDLEGVLEVYNLYGNRLYTSAIHGSKTHVPTDKLQSGTYFVKVNTQNNKQFTSTFVKY